MTLKQTITKELLDSVDDPVRLEGVFRHHSHSKGPFYLGLAEATSALSLRMDTAREQAAAAVALRGSLDREVETLAEQRRLLEEQVQTLSQQVQDGETKTVELSGLLDRAMELTHWGFGEAELSRLRELLANIAATQGAPPEEGVAQFFQTVQRFEQVVSLDLEAKRAETRVATASAKAERWEAEAQRREARSKARTSAIDLTEKLLAKGVKAQDLPHWEKLLAKAGVTAEELSGALENYGSLEALTSQKDKQAKELRQQTAKLEIQVKALTEQRDNAQTAVQAVRERALKEVKLAGQQLAREMKEAGELAKELIEGTAISGINYANLRSEDAALMEYIQVARILRSTEPEQWQSLPRDMIQRLLLGAALWAHAEGRNPKLPPPGAVQARTMISSYTRISLADALIWAMSGVFTQEERQALGSAR